MSDDGKARTEKLLATTEGVSAVDGGKKAFSGKNEELRTERFDGDANNFTYSSGDSSNTELKENIVTGDENHKRIESKSSYVSHSNQTFKSSTNSSNNVDNHHNSMAFDDQQQPKSSTTSTTHNQNNQSQHREKSTEHQSMTSSSSDHKSETMQLSQEPNTVREAFRLAQQPGKILSRHVERANETTNMITERKELDDGTIVTTKRYENIGGENLSSTSKTSTTTETKFKTLRDEEAFKLSQEPGKLLSRDITMKDPTTRLIVEKKELSDGTIVTTKRYETVHESVAESRNEVNRSSTTKETNKTQSRDEDAFKKSEKSVSRPTPAVRESILINKHHETVNNKSDISENEKQTQREVVEENITKKIYDTSCHCSEIHDVNNKHHYSSDFLKKERNEPYDVTSEIITSDHAMETSRREEMKKLEEVRKIEQKRVEEQMRVRKDSVDKKITRDLEQDSAHKAFASSLRSVTPPIDRTVPLPRMKDHEHTRSPSRDSTTTKKSSIHDVTKIDRRSSNRSVNSEKQHVSGKKVTSDSRKSTGEIVVDDSKKSPKKSRNSSPQKINSNNTKKSSKRDEEYESEIFSSTIVIDNKEKQLQDDLKIVQTIDTKNLSATTSVSDLEFVVPSKREKSLVSDLDDNVQIRINLNNMKDADDLEIKTTVSEVRRSTSPDKENSHQKREFKRSETFEERVKKLIGCDESDSLTKVSTETPHYAKPTFASYPNGSARRVSEIRERKAKIEHESQEIEKTASRRKSLSNSADFIEREKSENMKTSSVFITSSDTNKTTSNKIDEIKTTKMEAKTSHKAPETHVTVAKITISPTKSSSPMPSSNGSASIKTTSVTQINRTVKDTPTTRNIVKTTERDSDNETDQELARIMDKSSDKSTRKKLISNRKDSAPVKSSAMVNEKDKVLRSVSERTFKTDIVVKPVKVDTATPKKDSKRPTKCVSTKTINLTNLNVNSTINSSTLDDVVIDVQQAKSSREPSPNKVIPVPVKADEFINGHDMIYPDKITEPDEEQRADEPIKPKIRNIPIFEENTKQFVGLEITEVETEKSRIIIEESEDLMETINSSTLEVADRKRNSIQIEPIDDEGDEHAHLMSVSQKVNKFIETAEMLNKPVKASSPAPFKNEKVKLRDNSNSFKEKITKFSNTTDDTIMHEKKSKRLSDDIMIRSYDETLKNDDCLLSVSDKVQKFISSAEKLTSSEPQKSPELVKNAMRSSRRDHNSSESFLTKEKQQISTSTLYRDDRSDSKSTVKSGGSDITLKSTEAIKRARAVFENSSTSSTAQRDVKRHDDIMSRPSIFESRRSNEEKSKSPSPSSLHDDLKSTSRRGSSDSPRTPAYMRDQVSTKKDLFEKKISSSKLESEMLNRKSLSPQTSVDEHNCGHSVGNDDSKTHTVTRKISAARHYMSHTLASLEHCQRDRKEQEMTRTSTSRRGSSTSPVKYQRNVSESTNDSHVVDSSSKSPTKFGVELKRADSQTKTVKSRRTSGAAVNTESIDIEQIFDLEELEKLLEVVVGYEQRRRIRAQIRVVKKIISDKEEKQKSNSIQVKKVSTSSQARRISNGGTESLAQTRQVTKIMTTHEKPQKSESKTQKTIMTSSTTTSSTTQQRQQSTHEKPREIVTRIITDKSPRGIIENFNSKCTKPVESVVKIVKKTSTTSSSQRANAATKESRVGNDVTDSVTSSYGVGPTDSNGLPLFGLRALKKKDSNTTKSELKLN